MKKIFLLVILSCLTFSGFSQSTTAATYALSTQSATYTAVSGGTVVAAVAADDVAQTGIAIGFTFTYCGTNYTTLSANSNGFISLANSATAGTSYVNSTATLATIGAGRGVLMPLWDDLNGSAASTTSTSCTGVQARYITTGTAPNRVFTFEWSNWGQYHNVGATTPAGCGSFEVKLYETTNIIEFHYSSSSFTGNTATIGIANSAADFFTITNNIAFPAFSTAAFNSAITTTPSTGIVYRFCPQNIRTTASNGGPYCSGVTAVLTGVGTGTGASFAWAGPSSFTSTLLSPTIPNVTVAASGVYTLTGTIGTCTANQITNMTVNQTPPAITGPDSVCVGSSISLSNSLAGGSFTSGAPGIATATTGGVITGISAGSVVITYTVPTGCDTVKTIRVDALPAAPAAIGGANNTCQGSTTVLTEATSGGAWSTADASIASIDASGTVYGVNFGSTTITYTVTNSHGCQNFTTMAFTVNLFTLGSITGSPTVCVGATTTLSNTIAGGTWSTSNAAIASVNAGGVVAGVAIGSATITYNLTNACGSIDSTFAITVNDVPVVSPITGTTTFCEGLTVTLGDATASGTWSTSDATVASIDGAGNVTGVSGGAATISYSLTNACGTTTVTTALTINPLPVAGTITGPSSVCVAASITLSDASAGGTWSSSNVGIATVDASGNVTGVTAGTADITYTVTNGCGTAFTSVNITVIPLPTAGIITGSTTICLGASTTLADATAGGVWSSSDATIASIDAATGTVTGTGVGTATITYSVTTVCGTATTTTPITVNTTSPFAGTISGVTAVCPGASSSLSSTVGGGTWSSSDVTIATVNTGGVVTGVTSGSVTITYSVTTACGTGISTIAYTITSPAAHGIISGITTLCVGNSVALSESVAGGSWSTSNVAVVSVSAAGVATGMGTGTALISYAFSNGCFTTVDTTSITILAASSAGLITGPSAVCVGSVITLVDGIAGGTWSSSDNSIASINSSLGLVLGISVGSVTMSYTVTDACGLTSSTFPMTVITTPVAGTISGTAAICIAHTTTLTNSVTGGTWSSSNAAIASINSTGVMTGVSAGTATISYTVTNACGTDVATYAVSVSNFPNAGVINGPTTLCAGATALYTDTAVGGTWISSNTSLATVDASGNVTGIAPGLVNIYYAVANACGSTNVTIAVTIITTPGTGTITGAVTMCQGTTTTLADTASGGVWSSSNNAVATVSTTGVVTGVSGGGVTISYGLTNVCGTSYAVHNMTVNPLPNAGVVGGGTTLCIGGSATMTETVGGGTWSSSDPSVATIGTTGVVTALSGGTAIISYTVVNACGPASATATIIVRFPTNAGAITGTTTVCTGLTTALADTVTGGTWTTSNAGIASVNAAGVVTGVTAGSATITYTVTDACGTANTSINITVVSPLFPATIAGTTTFCAGTSSTLTPSVTGGTWNSGDTTIATVDASGIVTGVTGGSVIISYTNTNACGMAIATAFVTINPYPVPGAITGATALCVGVTSTMVDTPVGGSWTSSDPALATIDATSGVITPLVTGMADISYTVTNGCGSTTVSTTITVGDIPVTAGFISGPGAVCPGSSVALTESLAGGVWSSSDVSIATVDTFGNVTGVAAGAADISYTVTNSCGSLSTTFNIVVNTSSASGTITAAATTLCAGATDTLADATAGGVWSSSDVTIATVDTTGVVTGIVAGAVVISYTVSNSCGTSTATVNLNVFPTPILSSIIGPSILCESATTSLSNTYFGGTWSSSDASIATINASTGAATGVAVGTVTITYAATNAFGCSAMVTALDTVNPAPHAGTITAAVTTFCAGTTLALTDTFAAGTGTWSSSDITVATVDAAGLVTGVAAGTVDITYAVTNGCGTDYAIANLTVNPQPTAGPIIGPTTFCTGIAYTLANTTFGGTWATSDASVATVDATTGAMMGITGGFVTISYTVTNVFGCSLTVTSADTVHLSADPGILVASTTTLCAGTTVTFSDAVTGGTWSSSDTTVAVIDATGVVTARAAGTADISYSVTGAFGCDAFVAVGIIVDPSPVVSPVSGPTSMCYGGTLTLTDTTTGGVWSSSDVAIATIDPTTGVVSSSSSAGEVTLSYTITNAFGCSVSATQLDTISFSPLVTAIGGPTTICEGATATLTNGYSGGVWSSSDITVATIDAATGIVTGVSAGVFTTTYTITASSTCFTMVTVGDTVAVVPVVAAITGTTTVCPGFGVTLSDATTGGTWSSDATSVATVDASGNVTGIAGGTANISYTITNAAGCATSASAAFTVNPAPAVGAIAGTGNACLGEIITLTDTTAGGTWSSNNTAVITIDATSGDMTGVTMGSATISYTVTNSFGCATTVTIGETVNTIPTVSAITGASVVCELSTITLADATTGGSWTSANAAIATVGTSTGVVTGTGGGTVAISYTVTNAAGCYAIATSSVTVNAAPVLSAISGPATICAGTAITYTEDSTGGTWSTSNAAVASVSTTGLVTGVAAGTATISYSKTNALGCTRVVTINITVNAAPTVTAISGPTTVCEGSSMTLTDATAAGFWSSANAAIATVDASTGVVTGVAGGSVNIGYTVTSGGCTAGVVYGITVNPLPVVGAISGSAAICLGSSSALSSTTTGGTWSSSDATVASVSTSGVVYGLANGTATITYAVTSAAGCTGAAYLNVTVNPAPAGTLLPTSGSLTLCNNAPVNMVVTGTSTASTFQWYNGGVAIVGATNSSYITDTVGFYTVTVSSGSCTITLSGVTVLPPPNPIILHGAGNVIYTGSFATYQWYLNGTPISGATSSIYHTSSVGSYIVVVTDGNGCTDTSAALVITSNGNGVANLNKGEIRLYPNPASSIIKVEAGIKVNVSVVSPDGKIIIHQNDATTIDVSNLANGMYMIMVYDETDALLKVDKFIKVE